MTSAADSQSFDDYCVEAARQFITTVVSIDDDPKREDDVGGAPPHKKKSLKRPQKGLSHRKATLRNNSAKSSGKKSEQIGDGNGGLRTSSAFSLRTERLINALADKNILCSVFVPRGKSKSKIREHIVRAAKLAECADVVMLDWDLKGAGGSSTAAKIISQIVSDDLAEGGRLRLILIYTAQNDPSVILHDVRTILARKNTEIVSGQSFQIDSGCATVEFANTRIAILNKADTHDPFNENLVVPEEGVPLRIIQEFAKLSYGLFPSIALQSITAVRKSTHHLLSTLSRNFDPAIITHRCLLENPEDAEDFCLDIIAGEMRSAISLNRVGQKHAGFATIKKWLDAESDANNRFVDETTQISLNKSDIVRLAKEGKLKDKDFKELAKSSWVEFYAPKGGKAFPWKGKKDKLDLFLQIVGQSKARKAQEIALQFARLASLKRERNGSRHLPPDWQPTLTLGTVIRTRSAKNLFLCVQPRCDSVRIEKSERSFPFLTLHLQRPKGSGRISAIVLRVCNTSGAEKDQIYYSDASPHQMHMICFKRNSQRRIMADNYIFESTDGDKYEWVADIKDVHMLEFSKTLSDRQGAIGSDIYEWLRQR